MINEQNKNSLKIEPAKKYELRYALVPESVMEWLASIKTANNNAAIIEKFNLQGKNTSLAVLSGEVILKEISLEKFPEALEQRLGLEKELAKKVAIEVAILQFLPIRDYLKGVEQAVSSWGGILPTTLPPKISSSAVSEKQERPEAKAKPEIVIKKSLRDSVKENNEMLNQALTSQPLKINDFEQLVRPSIKNWLSDYVQKKGAKRHNEIERGDYLFNSPNCKTLSPAERAILSEVFRSYDEDTPLPISSQTNLVLFDKINPGAKEPPKTNQVPPSISPNAPKIDGHTIDLKSLNKT